MSSACARLPPAASGLLEPAGRPLQVPHEVVLHGPALRHMRAYQHRKAFSALHEDTAQVREPEEHNLATNLFSEALRRSDRSASINPLEHGTFTAVLLRTAPRAGHHTEVRLPKTDALIVVHSFGTLLTVATNSSHRACSIDLTPACSTVIRLDHEAVITSNTGLNAVCLIITDKLLDEVARIAPITRPFRFETRHSRSDCVIGGIGAALLHMVEGKAVRDSVLKHVALATSFHLFNKYTDEIFLNGRSESSLSKWQEKAAKDFMIEHLAHDISNSQIAASAGLSTHHFIRQFGRANGLTPHRWLMQVRIMKAEELLLCGELLLKEVATSCGFSDASHFSKAFLRLRGCPPSEWVEQRTRAFLDKNQRC